MTRKDHSVVKCPVAAKRVLARHSFIFAGKVAGCDQWVPLRSPVYLCACSVKCREWYLQSFHGIIGSFAFESN